MLPVKPEIIFVVENKLGGVAYLNKNIINNTSLREQAYVKVILVNQVDSDHPRFTDSFAADEVINFNFDNYENKYAVLKRLHKHLGEAPGAVVCNDGLEMQSIYLHGTNKTVYQIIHDFYNLKLAIKLGAITDVFITHTKLFKDVILSSDPENVQVYHLPHGVKIPVELSVRDSASNLRIVFTGRLVESKGVMDLYTINKLLKQKGVHVKWTIIGKGPLRQSLYQQWAAESNITFASPDTSEEVLSLMASHDLFVLPTRFEGSPVTVLEALASGLVPVVSDLPGGIREIVSEDIGRRIPVGENLLFASAIESLNNDRELLKQLKINARRLASEQFNILSTSVNYFRMFLNYISQKKSHKDLPPIKIGFRLDKKWLPNSLVTFLRRKIKSH